MIQVILVLNKIECLDTLISEFMKNGISGGTILDSHGMVRTARDFNDNPLFDMLREMFDLDSCKQGYLYDCGGISGAYHFRDCEQSNGRTSKPQYRYSFLYTRNLY